MKTEIMEKLKTELTAVKEIIDKFGVFDIEYLDLDHKHDFLNGFDYFVVTNTGTFFYIVLGSNIFPNISFDDIIYIRKGRGLSVSEIGVIEEFEDTINGNFDCDDILDYDIKVMKEIDFNRENRILTGGYD